MELIINSILNKELIDDTQRRIHEMLLKDTVDGKLYKYRTFDDAGYSIDGLKNGTLYCANPQKFNDPFDCQIGLTISSDEFICSEDIKLIKGIFEKLPLVLDKIITLKDCNKDERYFIEKILHNQSIINSLSNIKTLNSKKENCEFKATDLSFISQILRTILLDDKFNRFNDIYVDAICQSIENITLDNIISVDKNDDEYTMVGKVSNIDTNTDKIDFLMQITEKIFSSNNEILNKTKKCVESLEYQISFFKENLFCIGCLSTSYKNKLMWSHYADCHKGFCIEYDFSDEDKLTFFNLPFPVYYSDIRPNISLDELDNFSVENSRGLVEKITMSLLTKDRAWEYENEWRILISNKESPLVKMPKITCVYLGAMIDAENREKIIGLAKEKHIPVKQMKADRGIYELHAQDIIQS